MLNRIRVIIVLFALMAVGLSVQAGDSTSTPMDTLTISSANCEEVTVNYGHSSGDRLEMLVFLMDGSNDISPDGFTDTSGSPFSGSQTFTFSPPLTDGETVIVAAGVFENYVVTGAFKTLPDIRGRSPGVLIASSEISIEVSCDGESEIIEAPFGCNDGRLNQNACEPVAIYDVVSDDGIGMDVWEIDPETSVGTPSVYVSAEELAAAQAAGTTSRCTIATSSDGRTGVYLLAGGEIEVIHGPDFENKFFVFTFETYPSLPAVSTYVGLGLPSASAC